MVHLALENEKMAPKFTGAASKAITKFKKI